LSDAPALVVAGGVAVVPNLLGKSGPRKVIGAPPSVEPTDAVGWAQLADEVPPP
jgi:hypothetical protein